LCDSLETRRIQMNFIAMDRDNCYTTRYHDFSINGIRSGTTRRIQAIFWHQSILFGQQRECSFPTCFIYGESFAIICWNGLSHLTYHQF
jgi:hypothetical protein